MGKAAKSILKFAAPVLGGAAGSFIPGIGTALGSAIGSGVGSLASGGNIGQALLSGGGSYLGSNLFGNSSFVPGDSVGSGLASMGAGNLAAQLPASLAGTSLSGAAGGFLGSSLGENIGQSLGIGQDMPSTKTAGPSPYKPSKQTPLGLPGSLSSLGGLDPTQQSTGIATQGVYGGGQGKDENAYFLNLINNRLVGDNGSTASDLSGLAPIEQSYLSQLGITGQNPYDLLRGINSYQN